MAYEFTFTPRFQKHFKGLTVQEKKQLKNKLELLAQNPSHPSLRTKLPSVWYSIRFSISVNSIRIPPDPIHQKKPQHYTVAKKWQ